MNSKFIIMILSINIFQYFYLYCKQQCYFYNYMSYIVYRLIIIIFYCIYKLYLYIIIFVVWFWGRDFIPYINCTSVDESHTRIMCTDWLTHVKRNFTPVVIQIIHNNNNHSIISSAAAASDYILFRVYACVHAEKK